MHNSSNQRSEHRRDFIHSFIPSFSHQARMVVNQACALRCTKLSLSAQAKAHIKLTSFIHPVMPMASSCYNGTNPAAKKTATLAWFGDTGHGLCRHVLLERTMRKSGMQHKYINRQLVGHRSTLIVALVAGTSCPLSLIVAPAISRKPVSCCPQNYQKFVDNGRFCKGLN